jgi:CBS domain-containing protein
MGRLAEILQKRSPVVHLMGPDRTVADAVGVMAEHGVGAVPIMEEDRLIGIFSERDLLRRVISRRLEPGKTPLRDVMTPDPVTAKPGESREEAILKMRAVGCRHLPIVTEGVIIDMVSMRDLLFEQIAERDTEIDQLKTYIRGS